MTFDEDRSQVRTGAAPQVLAGLRNLVISLVRWGSPSLPRAAFKQRSLVDRDGGLTHNSERF